MVLTLDVDGRRETVDAPVDAALLYVLRNDLEKSGPKFGCGLAQCSACKVIIDGTAIPSCVTPARSAEGAKIETVESLRSADGSLHPREKRGQGETGSGLFLAGIRRRPSSKTEDEYETRHGKKVRLPTDPYDPYGTLYGVG